MYGLLRSGFSFVSSILFIPVQIFLIILNPPKSSFRQFCPIFADQKKKNTNMYRTNTCGELRMGDVSKEVTLSGWVQTIRKFGAITFIDLRDRYGITQLLFGEELNKQLEENPLGREFVLQATGTVSERSNKNPN